MTGDGRWAGQLRLEPFSTAQRHPLFAQPYCSVAGLKRRRARPMAILSVLAGPFYSLPRGAVFSSKCRISQRGHPISVSAGLIAVCPAAPSAYGLRDGLERCEACSRYQLAGSHRRVQQPNGRLRPEVSKRGIDLLNLAAAQSSMSTSLAMILGPDRVRVYRSNTGAMVFHWSECQRGVKARLVGQLWLCPPSHLSHGGAPGTEPSGRGSMSGLSFALEGNLFCVARAARFPPLRRLPVGLGGRFRPVRAGPQAGSCN
jgi:hypothetical protein